MASTYPAYPPGVIPTAQLDSPAPMHERLEQIIRVLEDRETRLAEVKQRYRLLTQNGTDDEKQPSEMQARMQGEGFENLSEYGSEIEAYGRELAELKQEARSIMQTYFEMETDRKERIRITHVIWSISLVGLIVSGVLLALLSTSLFRSKALPSHPLSARYPNRIHCQRAGETDCPRGMGDDPQLTDNATWVVLFDIAAFLSMTARFVCHVVLYSLNGNSVSGIYKRMWQLCSVANLSSILAFASYVIWVVDAFHEDELPGDDVVLDVGLCVHAFGVGAMMLGIFLGLYLEGGIWAVVIEMRAVCISLGLKRKGEAEVERGV